MDTASALVEFTRFFLAVFFTAVAAFYTVRIITRKRAESHELVFPGVRFCASWWNHMVFRAFRITIWFVCLLRLAFPAVDSYLGIIAPLHLAPILIAGMTLLVAGFVLALLGHFSLGHQWRSGIDPAGPDRLFTQGLFGRSRNPMFLGVALAQAGFFLALPSYFSGLCLLVGWWILRRQIQSEEHHLAQRFPEAYATYCSRVPRWL